MQESIWKTHSEILKKICNDQWILLVFGTQVKKTTKFLSMNVYCQILLNFWETWRQNFDNCIMGHTVDKNKKFMSGINLYSNCDKLMHFRVSFDVSIIFWFHAFDASKSQRACIIMLQFTCKSKYAVTYLFFYPHLLVLFKVVPSRTTLNAHLHIWIHFWLMMFWFLLCVNRNVE